MRTLVAVGQAALNKCRVAYFDGAQWNIFPFPDIVGRLWCCYSPSATKLWVAGGTGALGLTAPILYYWDGAVWTDFSSAISDAVYLIRIDGNGPNNVWVTGGATGALVSGAWNFNGASWTATKVNTIEIGANNETSVSSQGHVYHVDMSGAFGSGANIYSNVANPNFALFGTFGTFGLDAVSDSAVFATRNSGKRIAKYTTSWAVVELGQSAEIVAALDADNYIYVESISPGGTIYKTGNIALSGASTILSTIGPNHGALAYLAQDDIWAATIRWGVTWGSVPQLTHYEGGLSWSGPTNYNANGLDAISWYDLAPFTIYTNPLPAKTPSGSLFLDNLRLE